MTTYRIHGIHVKGRDERSSRPLPPAERQAYVRLLVGNQGRLAEIEVSRTDLLRLAEEAIYAVRLLDGPGVQA